MSEIKNYCYCYYNYNITFMINIIINKYYHIAVVITGLMNSISIRISNEK